MSRAIGVALPIPVDKVYAYELPSELDESVQIGSLVLVPVRNRAYTGVVTELDVQVRDGVQLRAVRAVISTEPLFDEGMMQLTRWISRYYICSWGEALSAALPQACRPKNRLCITLPPNRLQIGEIFLLNYRCT